MPKNNDTSALSRAQDILTQFLAEYQAMKQGRRHSAGDETMLNVIHDLAVELGAVCPGVGGEEEEMPSDDGEMKALTLWEIHDRVWNSMWSLVRPDYGVSGYDAEGAAEWGIADIYPEYAILTHYPDGLFYQVSYVVDDAGTVTVAERNDWTVVTREWLEAERFDSTLVMPGGEVKAVKQGEIGLVSGYLVRFSTADSPDLEGDFFTKDTDFGPHERSIVFYHHGLDGTLGVKTLGRMPAWLKKDDIGVWIDAQLDLRDEYEQAIFGMAQQGKQGWSSGTASHLVRRMLVQGKAANWLASWPLGLDASLTPTPAEPRNVAAAKAMSLKMYQRLHEQAPSLKAALQAPGEGATATAGGGMPATPASDTPAQIEEIFTMDPEELKALLSGVVQEQLAPVVSEVNGLKAALAGEPPTNDTGYQLPGDGKGGEAGEETFKAFYATRFGKDESGIKAQVMKEIAGGNYERFVWEQNAAFAKFLRWGDRELTREETKLLRRQVFAPTHVMMMIRNGFPVSAIKETMVTAQGSLGGYAMPPNMQEGIATRLPGLTAVRGNGATVITLLGGGTSTTVTRYTGGDNRYVGNLRGQWGAETQDPTEQNATLGEDEVLANTYTYKIVMSQDLVDGAANLVELVADDVLMTMAIDEDEADLVGDGAGKPLGILPSGVNALALAEVNSGGASALTTSGIKKLKRGIASQYRGRGVFVGNSDTYGLVEVLTVSGTGSDFAFPDLSETGRLLNRPAAESEAMPDVASNAYPLIYGDMSGYYIVEQPGMTMARFQDSGTGINKVEFQVRRKRGGRPVKLWLFAVQKVAA